VKAGRGSEAVELYCLHSQPSTWTAGLGVGPCICSSKTARLRQLTAQSSMDGHIDAVLVRPRESEQTSELPRCLCKLRSMYSVLACVCARKERPRVSNKLQANRNIDDRKRRQTNGACPHCFHGIPSLLYVRPSYLGRLPMSGPSTPSIPSSLLHSNFFPPSRPDQTVAPTEPLVTKPTLRTPVVHTS
jgi:hypothetical protein